MLFIDYYYFYLLKIFLTIKKLFKIPINININICISIEIHIIIGSSKSVAVCVGISQFCSIMTLTNKNEEIKMIEKNENKQEVKDLVYKLNNLEASYQHYMTNIDNIYAWACEQYNTDKPTAEQQESICEYPQNMSDYEKLTDKIAKKQKDIIADLGSNWAIEVEYDGWDYKIKEVK